MARKQLSYAARQAIAQQAMQNLNRQASVKKTGNDEFWNPTRSGQATWDAIQAEEKAENERVNAPIRAAQETLNKTFIAAQANELLTLPNDPYLAENCKQTDKPNTDEGIRNAFLVFRDVMLPAAITDAGIELLGRVTELNPKIDWASTSPLTFHTVWSRLESLGLVKDGTHITNNIVARTEQRQESLTDQEQVEADFQAQYFPLYADWLASMKKAWDFIPTQTQQRYALDVINETGMSPLLHATYDEVRRICCRRNVFPPMWTQDEALAERLAHSDLSTPAARAEYIREANKILYQE